MQGAARRPAHMDISGGDIGWEKVTYRVGERLTDMGYLVSFKYPDEERREVKRVD